MVCTKVFRCIVRATLLGAGDARSVLPFRHFQFDVRNVKRLQWCRLTDHFAGETLSQRRRCLAQHECDTKCRGPAKRNNLLMRWDSGGWAVRPIGVVMQANPSAVLLTRQSQETKRNERCLLLDQPNSRRIMPFEGPSKINGYNALLRENTTASKFTRSGYLGEPGGHTSATKRGRANWQAPQLIQVRPMCAPLFFFYQCARCVALGAGAVSEALGQGGQSTVTLVSYGSGFRGRGVCRALKMASVFVSIPYYIVVWLSLPFSCRLVFLLVAL